MQTLETILPLALSLEGKPYSLHDYFPFSTLYRCTMPKRVLMKTGRQVAKSTNQASNGVILSNCIPFFKILYVTPLYEQIRRFSNNYVRPFIDRSPIKTLWCGTSTENSVLQRSFKNLSTMLFSFALLDADRIRGVSAHMVAIDELQDMDPAHLPIINETLSASPWAMTRLTGTPKSLDNSVENAWKRSSQAEWVIPCSHCTENGRPTLNIPSLEFHVDKMIGPVHPYISERHPAVICHKCGQAINPRDGRWWHRYAERRMKFAGYHIPQLILPLHYARHDKWSELVAKREGWANTSKSVFYNEVLGESIDVGQKIVTETDLKKASVLPWRNTPNTPNREMTKRLKHYQTRVMGIDWGGGGEDEISYTAMALLGFTPDRKIDVLWGKRLVISQEHLREAQECLHWATQFRCDLITHDYTGAGTVRETVMVQAGFDLERVMGMQYVRAATRNLLTYVPASPLHNRAFHRLDKTRSLLYTCQGIKLGMIRFFEWDRLDEESPGLTGDFLALIEEKAESKLAGDIYTISRNEALTDDFAHAVNLGCCALWHMHGWPNFAEAAAVGRVTRAQIRAAGSRDFGWDEDTGMAGYFHQP